MSIPQVVSQVARDWRRGLLRLHATSSDRTTTGRIVRRASAPLAPGALIQSLGEGALCSSTTSSAIDLTPSRVSFGLRQRGIAALSILVVAMWALFASSALAGTRGQQVFVDIGGQGCGSLVGPVSITGKNQYGQTATWIGYSADGRSVGTPGWWWIGPVAVKWQRRSTNGFVHQNHDVTMGRWADWVVLGCRGTVYYPQHYRFNNLGGKVFHLLTPEVAWDPKFQKYVSRSYEFGYWDSHYVYKVNNHVGVDIKTGHAVVAESRQHWIVFFGAVGGGASCLRGTGGLVGPGAAPVRAVLTAWCGVGGALETILR